ncbi:MAG: protein kinase [Ktedonobacterales bacterium]
MQEWRLGSYELVRRLGEGGMAQVYLARDVRLGREVAVKVLDRRLAERPGFRERFLREARVAAAFDHPNIVPLYDFGEEGVLFLVMPYVSGGSLQDILVRTPLPMGEVATYGSQIADALAYAHQRKVVHRDVKPANMLMHADGRLMLSDFGLAKIVSASSRSATPRNHPDAGTPEYMAPEQIGGQSDERSDIYALGVVLYLLLTGRLPFTGASSTAVMEGHLYRLPEPPRHLNAEVTSAMEAVVMRALAKKPDERFQRASELGAALLGALIAAPPSNSFSLGTPRPISYPSGVAPLSGMDEIVLPYGYGSGAGMVDGSIAADAPFGQPNGYSGGFTGIRPAPSPLMSSPADPFASASGSSNALPRLDMPFTSIPASMPSSQPTAIRSPMPYATDISNGGSDVMGIPGLPLGAPVVSSLPIGSNPGRSRPAGPPSYTAMGRPSSVTPAGMRAIVPPLPVAPYSPPPGMAPWAPMAGVATRESLPPLPTPLVISSHHEQADRQSEDTGERRTLLWVVIVVLIIVLLVAAGALLRWLQTGVIISF